MELLNALKSMLASLTGKTSSDVLSTDGVMTINSSLGTPNGRIGFRNLATYMLGNGSSWGSLEIKGIDANLTSANDLKSGTIIQIGSGQAFSDIPEAVNNARKIIMTMSHGGNDSQTKQNSLYRTQYLFAATSTGMSMYSRSANGSTWGAWSETYPTFYASYANLAALATGIMGQTISSITAAYFQGTVAQAVFDNVFIAVTRLSDTYPLAVKPKDWSTYSSASAYHVDGVLLVSGDKHLVIAPADTSLAWGADSDTHAASGNTPTSDRDVAMAKFDGKTCTDTAVQVSEYSAATTACGYCHAYTTVTSAYDTTKTAYARRKAGMWWLPSLGEMMMIWSNMIKINQVMTLIGGTAIAEAAYWTSTEYSQATAWALGCSGGTVGGNYKKLTTLVRPVAAF